MAACLTSGEGCIDLVLIGKSGYGKSSVGNTILNYVAFDVSQTASTLTKLSSCAWGYDPEMNKEIKIVDTPGTTELAGERAEKPEQYIKDFPYVMGQCPKGFHALVLVLKYGVRFTEEDQEAVTTLRKMFGENFVTDHCIIVMTYGDKFELEYENQTEATGFESWCDKQTGAFQDLLQECDRRIVLFYNKLKKFEKQRKAAVVKLIRLAVKLSEKGRYTNKDFEKCYQERERLLLELPKLSLEIQRKCSLLRSLVTTASNDDNLNENKLKNIKSLIEDLEKEIKTKDQGTNLLNKELEAVQDIKKQVEKLDPRKSIKEQFEPTIRVLNFIQEINFDDADKMKATVFSVFILKIGQEAVTLGTTVKEYEVTCKTKTT